MYRLHGLGDRSWAVVSKDQGAEVNFHAQKGELSRTRTVGAVTIEEITVAF